MYKIEMCLLEVTEHNLLSHVKGSTRFGPIPYRGGVENLCPMADLCFLSCMLLVSFPDRLSHHTCEIIIVWRSKVLSIFDLGGKRRPWHLGGVGGVLSYLKCLNHNGWEGINST